MRRALASSLLLLLAGCASGPQIATRADGDPVGSRVLLEQLNQQEPLPLLIRGRIPAGLPPQTVAQSIADGVAGQSFRIVAVDSADPTRPRMLLLFAAPETITAWRACDPNAPEIPVDMGDPLRAWGIVCDGNRTVSYVQGVAQSPTGEDVTRLLWRIGGNLFPDPWQGSASGVRPSGWGYFGSGGSNVGIGIGVGF